MTLTSVNLTRLLTFSGAIPFAVFAIPHFPFIDETARIEAFLAYGAVIASFMAGTLWGFVQVRSTPHIGILLASNVFALAAWGTLLAGPGRSALLVQLLLFAGMLLVDRELANRSQEPRWYWDMRLQITATVCLCYLAAILLL
jgi:hypothetical protein